MARAGRYFLVWLGVGAVLAGLLGFAEYRRNPLHDPDQAHQRTGSLLPARRYASPRIADVPRPGRRAITFFARSLEGQQLFHDLADQADLAAAADLIVVTADGSKPVVEGGIRHFATDRSGRLADAFGLNRPIDGGFPIGYVLVDSEGFIRYRTLDHGFMHRASDIKTMLGGLP